MAAIRVPKPGKKRAGKSTFHLLHQSLDAAYTARECLALAGFGYPETMQRLDNSVIKQTLTIYYGRDLVNIAAALSANTMERSQKSKHKRKRHAEYMRKNRDAGRWTTGK
jgi:hypothetical protein